MDTQERICYIVDISGWLHKVWGQVIPVCGFNASAKQQINFANRKLRDRCNALADELRALYAEGVDTELHAALDSGPTWRHDLYPGYKAQRPQKTPIQLEFFAGARDILLETGFEVWISPGYEADDIMARIATARASEGWEVRVVTDDGDLFQLATDRIKILANKSGGGKELLDAGGVEARLGYAPSKVPLMKALAGDAGDGIPGVRGVGVAKALPLVRSYESVDAIYADLDHIPEPLKSKLAEVAPDQHPRIFERLATLSCETPLKRVQVAESRAKYANSHKA